jgi:hypothetical protein
MTIQFLIQHHKSSPYHPKSNVTIEEFKNILERWLTNVFFTTKEDWDERVPTFLWAYRTTINNFHKYTLFQLVYKKEDMVPTEFITPSIYIAQATHMTDDTSIAQRIADL